MALLSPSQLEEHCGDGVDPSVHFRSTRLQIKKHDNLSSMNESCTFKHGGHSHKKLGVSQFDILTDLRLAKEQSVETLILKYVHNLTIVASFAFIFFVEFHFIAF